MIVKATRELLETRPSSEVSFARVARQLGVPGSSVYNYFANRDVLLAAVADDVFARFAFTDPGDAVPWQQRLSAWLQELDRFIEKNPVAFRVMATSSQASPAWVHVRAPLLRVLRSLGFVGRELVLVHSWCEAQVVGLLLVENHAVRNRAQAAAPSLVSHDGDDMDDHAPASPREQLPPIRREEILKLGFDAVILALERMVR
jgi:TetR/AcrR family transcriptional regulator, tetracycline repressor protein